MDYGGYGYSYGHPYHPYAYPYHYADHGGAYYGYHPYPYALAHPQPAGTRVIAPPGGPAIVVPPNARATGQATWDVDTTPYAAAGWPNPTYPRPYPRPRPDPNPPPPCPGHHVACAGTCGNCGHVGCGATLPYICNNSHNHQAHHNHNQGSGGGCNQGCQPQQGCAHHGCAHHACGCRNGNHCNCAQQQQQQQQQPVPQVIIESRCCRCVGDHHRDGHPPPRVEIRERYWDRDRDRGGGERIRGEYVGGRFRPDTPPPYYREGRWYW
ncbi:hypothetical protein GE09DRAFT_512122 [Coniochaeta sp. 2T2.1]|nr:hypothetical protein GE09DRAFT_512122 [Coniochaeta sp. 2T2.1]